MSNIHYATSRDGKDWFAVEATSAEIDLLLGQGLILAAKNFDNDTDRVGIFYLTDTPSEVEQVLGLEVGKALSELAQLEVIRKRSNADDAWLLFKDVTKSWGAYYQYKFNGNPEKFFYGDFEALKYVHLQPSQIFELAIKEAMNKGLIQEVQRPLDSWVINTTIYDRK